jgi:ribosome assembly protein YihI (activator of Der GTPase)
MPLTLTELEEKLKQIDEITLLERLEISSEDIVDRFEDRIEERFEQFEIEFEEDDIESSN